MKQKQLKEKEISVVDFLTNRFPNEEVATTFFAEKRWGNKIVCPYCTGETIYKITGTQPYKCGECNRKFTVKTRTIMEGSHVPVRIWLLAMYIMGVSRKGISSIQLAKQLGVTQKTAWYMAHRIREACDNIEKMNGIIEVDETYIGGKEKNKHASKRFNSGRGVANKTPVVGLRERQGNIMGRVVRDTGAYTLQGLIQQNVMPKSAVFTDDHRSYIGLDRKGYKHHSVNHSGGEYVDGVANTNGIESFWALLKRALYGTYHNVSKKHLQRYVNEFAFRSNRGNLSLSFIEAVCGRSNGGMLQYSQLIQ